MVNALGSKNFKSKFIESKYITVNLVFAFLQHRWKSFEQDINITCMCHNREQASNWRCYNYR